MKVLILSQSYFPDTVSVSQHLTDFAESLVQNGHEVRLITSVFGYDSQKTFPRTEVHNGVRVIRIHHTNFSKRFFLLRALNFLTFNLVLFFKATFSMPKPDLVIGLTFPPFSALVGIGVSKIRKVPFVYWVLDLQPELAIASGLIKTDSILASIFTSVGNYLIKKSNHIISLDRFMSSHLVKRGAVKEKISQIPVWPVSEDCYVGARLSNPFRISNGFGEKLVVMYSGNHAYVHPMDTLLLAIELLAKDSRFHFAFVGGGVRKQDVSEFKKTHELKNVSQHPFQPRSEFHISIGASDLQVVIMGDGQVGFTHPNKIYGAMLLKKPILYIGPSMSHVGDILGQLDGNIMVEHGDVDGLTAKLIEFGNLSHETRLEIGEKNMLFALRKFDASVLRQSMVECVEKVTC